jgi:hypothetical protein
LLNPGDRRVGRQLPLNLCVPKTSSDDDFGFCR